MLLTKHVGGERALLEKMSTKNKSSLAVEDDKVRASPWWQMQGASGRPSAKRRKAAAAAPSVSSYAETTGVATRDTTYATFSDGAEPVFVFGPGAGTCPTSKCIARAATSPRPSCPSPSLLLPLPLGGRTAKNMHKVLNKLVLPGGGAAVTRLDDNEAGKVKWSTFHAGGDRNCKAAVEKLNEVAKAHPSRPVFYIGASFGCRVGVAVMATRRAELEANVCDAMILTGFPLYPDEPKTEKKKMARVVHLATTLPSTRALIVAGMYMGTHDKCIYCVSYDNLFFFFLSSQAREISTSTKTTSTAVASRRSTRRSIRWQTRTRSWFTSSKAAATPSPVRKRSRRTTRPSIRSPTKSPRRSRASARWLSMRSKQ